METFVSENGEITIPAELLQKYGITPNTKILIIDNGNEIILRPINAEYIKRLRGSLKGSGALEFLMEERKRDRERENKE